MGRIYLSPPDVGPLEREFLLDAFDSHFGGAGGLCAHPAPDASFGERYATLATILLDVEAGGLTVHAGGPCSTRGAGSTPLTLTAQG